MSHKLYIEWPNSRSREIECFDLRDALTCLNNYITDAVNGAVITISNNGMEVAVIAIEGVYADDET